MSADNFKPEPGDIKAVVEDGIWLALAIKHTLQAQEATAYAEAVETLGECADRATQTHARVLGWWIADSPAWAPDTSSVFEGLCRLGSRLFCSALAAGLTSKGEEDSLERFANSWQAGLLLMRRLASSFDEPNARAALRREASLIASRPRQMIPDLVRSDPWLLDLIEACEQLSEGDIRLAPDEREQAMRTLSEPQRGEKPETTAEVVPPFLCAADLARCIGQPKSRVETFLRRYREDHPDCFVEVEEGGTRKNEPRILYRTADVWPDLLQKLPKWDKLTDG
jgi:hypothetical protein